MAQKTHGLRDLTDFIKESGKMPKELSRQMRPMMRQSAQKPLAEVKRNASWSRRIPGATKISVRFTKRFAGTAIVTDKNKARHARPIEHRGKPGTFRHRVFGTNKWVKQKARPFQAPVAKTWFKQADRDIAEVVDKVIKPLGYK